MSSKYMELTKSRATKAITYFFIFLIFFNIPLSYPEKNTNWSAFYGSTFPLATALIIATLLAIAVRTTMVTWITVLVLLAFVGKRRRILVKEGREITSDVAMYLFKVVFNQRGFLALACAAIVSLMTMPWLS